MDEPGHPLATILVAVAIVVIGALAIALLRHGQQPPLQPPDRFGVFERTPSEEVSTPTDMIATYTAGPHVAVLSVSSADEASDQTKSCVSSSGSTQCNWSDGAFDYTLVNNSSDVEATRLFTTQAEDAFKAANGR